MRKGEVEFYRLVYEKYQGQRKIEHKKAQIKIRFELFRDPDRIRTCDLLLRRQLLYPAELPDHS